MRRSRPTEGSKGSGSTDGSIGAADNAFWGAVLGDFETQAQERLEHMSTALDAFAAEATGRASRVGSKIRSSSAGIRAEAKKLSKDSAELCDELNAILKTQQPRDKATSRIQLSLRASVTKANPRSQKHDQSSVQQWASCAKSGATETREQIIIQTRAENKSAAR